MSRMSSNTSALSVGAPASGPNPNAKNAPALLSEGESAVGEG
jgi:hypothetical protein